MDLKTLRKNEAAGFGAIQILHRHSRRRAQKSADGPDPLHSIEMSEY